MTVTCAPDDVEELMYEFLTDDRVRFFEEGDETRDLKGKTINLKDYY
ncbi:MAG: hypothetical protein P8I31_02915 [Bacteroidia bacterium]|nr:hypothetical protein [Bacteroidia bacterium]